MDISACCSLREQRQHWDSMTLGMSTLMGIVLDLIAAIWVWALVRTWPGSKSKAQRPHSATTLLARSALLDIPGEIRNLICMHTFAWGPQNDLLNVTPPSRSLILTCKQVNAEARTMCRAARRSWFRQDFLIQLPYDFGSSPTRTSIYNAISKLDIEVLERITSLRIYGSCRRARLSSGGTWTQGVGESFFGILHVPPQRLMALRRAGFPSRTMQTCSPTLQIFIDVYPHSLRAEAMRIVGRSQGPGVTREELISVVMDVGEDWKGPYGL